jgi:protease PrsW
MLYYLLALALGPGIAIILYIYWRDEHDREPLRHLLVCFLLGLLSILPAFFVELWLSNVQAHLFAARTVSGQLFSAFIVAAAVEEGVKFLACRVYAYPKRDFNEPLDGIVYMVMVATGFATVENFFYIFSSGKGGLSTGFMRMFLAVPGHACWAVIMGYFMGNAKFKPSFLHRTALLLGGLVIAILLHGTYDALLFMQETDLLRAYALPLFGGAILTAVLGYVLAFKAIKRHRLLSYQMFVLDKNAPLTHGNDTLG